MSISALVFKKKTEFYGLNIGEISEEYSVSFVSQLQLAASRSGL